MANDQLEVWQAIEDAGDDEAKSMQGRFGVPSPACDRKQVTGLPRQAGEVGVSDRLRRRTRVKINSGR